ncbi:hypothetical protein [Baekduia sp. Peel2402]|uniref:hypothetical protein n=1 Tax=Baekduia sp. Peel2402 TaxID=3458296 RepID=UPI00403E424D
MIQILRALLVSSLLALLLAGSAAANPTIVPNGRAAAAVTDRDGVTHMVYNIPNGVAYDTVGYCRIAKGAQTCQDVKELTFGNLPCIARTGSDSSASERQWDSDFLIDKPQVQVSRFGEVFVLWPAFCPHGQQMTMDMLVWTSTDAGDTFDNGHQLGHLTEETPEYSSVLTWSASILDAADRTIVSATFERGCGLQPGAPGAYVQSAPLGAYTSDRARMSPIACGTAGYYGHPTIVQRGKRSYATAWTEEQYSRVQFRAYDHPELPPSAVNNSDNWSAAVDLTPADTATTDYATDQAHLVSGPLGTFLFYRQQEHDRNSGQYGRWHWLLRRVNGAALGPATDIPQPVPDEGFFRGDRAQTWAGGASIVQDEANGRLHFARFVPGTFAIPNLVQYLTSDDGVTWTANTYLPDPTLLPGGDRHHDLGGFDDDWGQYAFDPVLAESTSINGFTGIVGESRGFADDGYQVRTMYPFGVLPLPYRDPPPSPGDPGGGDDTPPPPSGGGGGTTPAPAPAPAPNPQDQRCKILQFAALDIVADACLTQDKGVYVAKGGVSVNGMKITGAEVRFDPKDLTLKTTGPVTVTIGSTAIIKGVKLDWKLPKTNIFDLGSLDVGALGSKLFGFGLKGDVDVKLVRGAVEIKSHIGLPGILGGITADVTLRADNLAGLHARELWVRFPSAKLGPLELADVEFNYNPEEDAWGGTLGLTLPPNPPGPKLKATIGFKDGEITDLAGELTLPGQGIAIDPTGIAWLTKIRAAMHRPPLTLKGGITIGGGPMLDSVTGERVVTVDGDITITLPDSGPSTFRADGQASIMGIPFATAYFQFITDGQVSAGGKIKADFGPFSAEAGADGWFNGKAFNIHGGAELCAAGVCVGGDIVFSSIGFAACADIAFTEIGAGIKWGDDLWAGLINPFWLLSHIDVMPVGCDVGPYQARAAAAQAAPGGERSVSFDAGLPSGFVSVIGQGAPPHVALVGPDGTRVEPTATTAVKTPGAFAFQSAKGNLTWFAVKAPKAGTWKIVPEADSVPIASVSTAKGLPAPKVTASVKRTSGAARLLSYKIEPQPGQTVTFTEQGAKAGIGAAIGKAKGSTGTLRFTPTGGPGGTRKIIALVAQNGMPRKELTVARYVAPAPPKPARPKLKVKRVGTKLVVSWAKDGVAKRWTARITLSDGRVVQLLPRKPTVSVAGVTKTTTGRIAVYGEDSANRKGSTATATLRKVVTKKKAKAKG